MHHSYLISTHTHLLPHVTLTPILHLLSKMSIYYSNSLALHSLLLNMESFTYIPLLLLFLLAFCLTPGGLAWALLPSTKSSKFTIPGPSGLPLLGSLFIFTHSLTHRLLAKLSYTFNAVKLMAFSVGFTRFIISSHPDTAKDILNSTAFADRPVKESAYELLFNRAMGFAPYGDYWRNLRRISAMHLFNPKIVTSFGKLREEIGEKMVSEIVDLMAKNGKVEVRRVVHFGSLNNVMMSVFGKRYYEFDEMSELEDLVSEGYELLGKFNWTDHFPVLGYFDLQGVRWRCRNLVGKVNVFVGKIIQEHKSGYIGNIAENSGDFLHVLLDLEKENKITHSDMIAVLWEMIFRGTDTVAILLEWILARMVLHPDIQLKAQSEIDKAVTPGRLVSDSDLPNLPYILAIIKETLRLHPPGPLLSWARLATHDTTINGHFIAAGTTAMVNMWAITHSSEFWPEPEKFLPERFMDKEVNIMGNDLKLAPFGSGRRVCPGKAMGLASVQLWLAELLQSFTWVAVDGCTIDLSECLKLSLEMKKPLLCKAVTRV